MCVCLHSKDIVVERVVQGLKVAEAKILKILIRHRMTDSTQSKLLDCKTGLQPVAKYQVEWRPLPKDIPKPITVNLDSLLIDFQLCLISIAILLE